MKAFIACLQRQGVDVPSGPPPGQGAGGAPPFDPQDPAVRKAFAACQDKLPQGGMPPGGGPPGGAP